MLTLLTGRRGAGKTTTCLRLMRQARARDLHVTGLISPARFADGRKIGIDLLDISSGEQRPLADLAQPQHLSGPRTLHWQFRPETMAWAQEALRRAAPCDLLIVDELGPLELEQQQGWRVALEIIDRRDYRHALVVVRPELLARARELWPQARILEIASPAALDLDALAPGGWT